MILLATLYMNQQMISVEKIAHRISTIKNMINISIFSFHWLVAAIGVNVIVFIFPNDEDYPTF